MDGPVNKTCKGPDHELLEAGGALHGGHVQGPTQLRLEGPCMASLWAP